jgi:hypothetical protein
MTDRPTNEEREALIADGRGGRLEPDEAADVALLADLLADPATWAEPDADLEEAVVRAVADAEPGPLASVTPPAPGEQRKDVSRRKTIVLSALAAVAAVAIVLAVATTIRSGPRPSYTAQLSGTELASGATASGEGTRNEAGYRITLDAHGLPALPADEYYQAWLKNASGTLVPIGTFSSSDGRITLWSGVDPSDYPTMTVTIEAADNDQTSSGRRVLQGEVHAN